MIDSKQIEQAVNLAFESPEEFAAMLKLLAGVGKRVKLEVQVEELSRKSQLLQVELQTRQAARQSENVADSQSTEKETLLIQEEITNLRQQIDYLNSQMPELL